MKSQRAKIVKIIFLFGRKAGEKNNKKKAKGLRVICFQFVRSAFDVCYCHCHCHAHNSFAV